MALFASTQPPLQSFDAGACAAATLNSCLVACPTGAASLATASGAIVGVEGLEHAQTQLLKAAGPGALVGKVLDFDGSGAVVAVEVDCDDCAPAGPYRAYGAGPKKKKPLAAGDDAAAAFDAAAGTLAADDVMVIAGSMDMDAFIRRAISAGEPSAGSFRSATSTATPPASRMASRLVVEWARCVSAAAACVAARHGPSRRSDTSRSIPPTSRTSSQFASSTACM